MTNTYQIQATLVCTTQTDTAEKALDFLALRLTTTLPALSTNGQLNLTLDVDDLDFALSVLQDCPNTFIKEINQITQLEPTPMQARNFLDEHTISKVITRSRELSVSEYNLAFEPTEVTQTTAAFDVRNKKTNQVTRFFQWNPDALKKRILEWTPIDFNDIKAATIIQQFDNQNTNRQLVVDNTPIDSADAFVQGKDFKNGIEVTRPSEHTLHITCLGQSDTYTYEIIAK